MLDGQTIGLPVGPDSSRIISEIILSSIDQELESTLSQFKGVRIIDDYYLYFSSLSEVETARSVIHKALRGYELELNPRKETVIDLPELMETNWYKDLKTVRFSNDQKLQRKELIAFFDKAFFHAKRVPDDAVLSYAITKIRPTIFHEKNLILLQSLLLNSIVQESRTIALLAEILISYNASKHKLDLTSIKFALEQFIMFHCDLNNEFETSWALWTMKALKLSVTESTAKSLSGSSNSIVILVCLDLKQAGLIKKGLDTTFWTTMMTKEQLYSENWLLAYEAKLRGWLKTADNYLDLDPFFKVLKDKKVHFYKPMKTLDTSKVRVAAYDEGEADEKFVLLAKKINEPMLSKDLPF